ncbi:membrane protein UL124 [Aotine betaherpesvirus 1]|uniref:Membrane protein UL124 n=1 Tax=Aotine betaherpesvirus 1 TaxID=50290 RepID=G8XUI1_9BETA|nr:membrane protein UL124 [Aotine betaherpesvirus 1]AEV80811.1 membrane protein UL124 [Aotine betaherpesvirus 1]
MLNATTADNVTTSVTQTTNHSSTTVSTTILTSSQPTTTGRSSDRSHVLSFAHNAWMRPVSSIGAILCMFGLIITVMMCSFCSTDKNLEEAVQEIMEEAEALNRVPQDTIIDVPEMGKEDCVPALSITVPCE